MKRTTLRLLSLAFLLFLVLPSAWATHNRAGEIIVETVTDEDGNCGLTVKATIITYTKTSSTDADRDSLTICWGDDTCERVVRNNGPGTPPQGEALENDIKFNIYMATHTYTGPSTYVISFEDPNRNAGVQNVNFPNSVSIPFYVENVFSLFNPLFSGCNNSPVLQVPPIDFACLGEVFTHNPGAFDVDGDSLSYELAVPKQGPGDPVPMFFFPSGMSINEVTGDLVWDSPNRVGEFNIAINIYSYRNGVIIDTMVRDMQIIVRDCSNDPPLVITDVDEICVIAGTIVDFDVTATAPLTDSDQRVRLLAYGAPFNLDISPAEFTPPSEAYFDDPLVKNFRWQTTCEHISSQPYNVVFRAVDDFLGDTTGLATLKTIRIKVIGPPPEDVQTDAVGAAIELSWELPYVCEDAADDYFRGFSVWRRLNSDQSPLDTCAPGLAGRGYTKISSDTLRQIVDNRYFFLDNNVERGKTYCYRILANFARRTSNGLFFFNPVESLPSDEACVQLGRDVPLLTKVDVVATDLSNGVIDICWAKPDPDDLDTLNNPGPYTYEFLRASGHTENPANFTVINSFTAPTFEMANDTCFTDTNLNTVDFPYSYLVNFYVDGGDSLGASTVAASVYLNATPSDRVNTLFWDELVPWENFEYTIFRENAAGQLDSLTTVTDPIYRDEGLQNLVEYCYVVRAAGTYNIDGLPSPLLNRSQRVCSTPIDNVPPCPPELTVTNLCDESENCDDIEDLENELIWESAATLCPEFEDVAAYRIYYASEVDTPLSLIATVNDPDSLMFLHRPPGNTIAGCYAVTAVDTVGNESLRSNIVCVDNCPVYLLPNAFTPNGDNQNDLFTPTRSCFIDLVEFQVYNRWGGLVYETDDPLLNWDGTNLKGDALEPGTYFYRCRVFERRVDGGLLPSPDLLSGYIELIKSTP